MVWGGGLGLERWLRNDGCGEGIWGMWFGVGGSGAVVVRWGFGDGGYG